MPEVFIFPISWALYQVYLAIEVELVPEVLWLFSLMLYTPFLGL